MEINPAFSENAKDDFRLVVKAKEGDQKAYASLMQRYKEGIYFMALKMLNNKEDAMDITVETFGKAFENLDKYRPEYAFSTWLFRIATNNCIDFIRKRKLSLVSMSDMDDGEGKDHPVYIVSDSLNPEENSIIRQQRAQLKLLVDNLPERHRKLIILRFYEEFSYSEIAEQLDLPLGTVKTQLYKAKRLLHNILRKKIKIDM
jgi:RNA polymerase sigma-70 factor (ECF subfamily)